MKNRDYLPEQRIKRNLQKFLSSSGWSYYTDMVTSRSVDIKAKRGEEKWIIEIKRSEPLTKDIVASFVSVIGKIVQLMDDENCKYSIALPDKQQFRRLWDRLPDLAKERTGITALFVNYKGDIHETNN
jgi:hypothetical protein